MKVKTSHMKRILAIVTIVFLALIAAALALGMSDTHESLPANDVVAVSAEEVEDTAPAAETTEAAEADSTGAKAIAAGIAIGLAAAAGAVGMGIAIAKSNEAISRQPEADGKIRSTLMLGLILIETAIIYALVIAILIIFAL